jgi:PAS domain S-box-containing protein
MTQKKVSQIDSAGLRRLAEEHLGENRGTAYPPGTEEEPLRLHHELQVHQVELEMQNAELRQARDDLETALAEYTDLYDFAPVGYFTLDRKETIRRVNLTGAGLVGVERSRLAGRRFGLFVTNETRPAFTAFLEKVFTNPVKVACEVALQKEGNDSLSVQIEGIATASGQECRIALIDITERKRQEKALHKINEQWRALTEHSPDLICRYDVNAQRIYINPAFEKLAGKTAAILIGKIPVVEPICSASVAAKVYQAVREVLGGGESTDIEVTWEEPDGRTLHHHVLLVPEFDRDGAVMSVLSVGRDITSLKENEEKYRALFENSMDAIFLTVPNGQITAANQAACEMFGMTEEELTKAGRDGMVDTTDRRYFDALEERARTGRIFCEQTHIRKDGTKFPTETSSCILDDGSSCFALLRDITARKQSEEALRDYVRRLIEMEEELRKKLAAELHDEIGRDLTSLGINYSIISDNLSEESRIRLGARIEDSGKLIEGVSRTIRNIMAKLRPPVLDDYGLPATLRWYADIFSKRNGIAVSVRTEDPFPSLAAEIEMTLFRIAQEALTNVAKYADALNVAINLGSAGGIVRLTVIDDGKGFAPGSVSTPYDGSGWGLTIMRERAELFGGTFRLDSEPGKGTVVSVEIRESL